MTWQEYYEVNDPDRLREIRRKQFDTQKYGVVQIDDDGNILGQFESLSDAAKSVGGMPGHISSVCSGKRQRAYGFAWKYADVNFTSNKKGNASNHNPSNKRSIYRYDLHGAFVREYESIAAAAKELGVASAHISAACLNKRQTAYGSIWKFANGDRSTLSKEELERRIADRSSVKKIAQFDLASGEFIREFDSLRDAAAFVGCSPSAISAVCSSKRKQSCGYIWKYI